MSAGEREERQLSSRTDDDAVNRVTTYIPWAIAKGTGLLQDEVSHQFGIHGVLEDQGHVMTRLREDVSTRMPGPEEIRLLRLRRPASGLPAT